LLLIDLLEEEPDDCVRSAITETLGKLAVRAQEVGVIDAERVIPGWKADGNPFVIREHFSGDEFAPEVVDRLEHLCETEGGTEILVPLVMPQRIVPSKNLPRPATLRLQVEGCVRKRTVQTSE
jgi:hypothetical protein